MTPGQMAAIIPHPWISGSLKGITPVAGAVLPAADASSKVSKTGAIERAGARRAHMDGTDGCTTEIQRSDAKQMA